MKEKSPTHNLFLSILASFNASDALLVLLLERGGASSSSSPSSLDSVPPRFVRGAMTAKGMGGTSTGTVFLVYSCGGNVSKAVRGAVRGWWNVEEGSNQRLTWTCRFFFCCFLFEFPCFWKLQFCPSQYSPTLRDTNNFVVVHFLKPVKKKKKKHEKKKRTTQKRSQLCYNRRFSALQNQTTNLISPCTIVEYPRKPIMRIPLASLPPRRNRTGAQVPDRFVETTPLNRFLSLRLCQKSEESVRCRGTDKRRKPIPE